MIYTLTIRFQEDANFLRILKIDSEKTFLHLHEKIVAICEYDSSQLASFYTLAETGEKTHEIALMEMSSAEQEFDIAVMDVTVLREFLQKEGDKLRYVFDFFSNRAFSIHLEKMEQGTLSSTQLVSSEGEAPQQLFLEGIEDSFFEDATHAQTETDKDDSEIDYEKYLSEFDDCNEDISFESLDELEEEF